MRIATLLVFGSLWAGRLETQQQPVDSTATLVSGTWVRVQLATIGTDWQLGQLARKLPEQCVMVLVPISGDVRDGWGGHGSTYLNRLEVWRGPPPTQAPDASPDTADDRQWAPYSLAALRANERAAGCTTPE